MTSDVCPVILRRAVTGDALRPASSHRRVASITCSLVICVTSGSYTNEMAGMLATDVIGTFCPLVGTANTCFCGVDEQAVRPSTMIPPNNFFISLSYVDVVCKFNVSKHGVIKMQTGLVCVGY